MYCVKDAQQWWALPAGLKNCITDVPGVRVGHATTCNGSARTGVTAVLPHEQDMFRNKTPAGAAILNGFGKSLGLVQLQELGQIETPILLTNTFGVPVCATALIRNAIAENPNIGRGVGTVNPLVMECNDGQVNDIQSLPVTEELANAAIENASAGKIDQGTVGAGIGMRTFGFAGGIGTSSRRIEMSSDGDYYLGALVLSNFGQQPELRIMGKRLETPRLPTAAEQDKGSIIIILATNAPLDSRQLTRVARRTGPALGRMGSYLGHQSGDIAVAFSTANVFAPEGTPDIYPTKSLREDRLDLFFHAAVEATEEAVLSALWHAQSIESYKGTKLPTIREKL